MAPKSENPEAIVLNYMNEQNRPLNSQNVADSLQKFNLKKAAIQKALDALADNGKISFKEYGKQKVYLARQDQFDIPNSEELTRMKQENEKLQEQLGEQKKVISEVEGEIKTLQANLTLEQIRDKEAKLRKEVAEMEDRVEQLRGGVTLVKPEDRKAVEQMVSEKISQWRKRRRMFKDLWDAITENSPKDVKEFKVCLYLDVPSYVLLWSGCESSVVLLQEELGIEYDEDVGVSLQSFSDLRSNKRSRLF
ncbi:homologous-pairing protein 2 homolog isoform X1 [Pyrus communis]|uniref:homologous-pairing protein 2 homolog isoform X1 n=1 Tax=Pyrus communis TaxID=23211 RepID=UPI0035BF3EF6